MTPPSQTPAPPGSRYPLWMGGFGVTMGVATFALMKARFAGGADSHPLLFLAGLGATALTSYVIESVRSRAAGVEAEARHGAAAVLGTLVLLACFEFFVSGTDELVDLFFGDQGERVLNAVFTQGLSQHPSDRGALAVFMGLWLVLGMATAQLAYRGAGPLAASARARWQQLGLATLKGFALLALLALAYVFAARLAHLAYLLALHPELYTPDFASLLTTDTRPGNPFSAAVGIGAVLIAQGVEHLAHTAHGGLAVLAAVAVVIAVMLYLATRGLRGGAGVAVLFVQLALGGGLLLVILGPLLTDAAQRAQLLHVVFASALVWLAPLIVLGVAGPLLCAPAHNPRFWGMTAFAVAVVLVAVTWQRLRYPPDALFFAVLALLALLAFVALLFLRGAELRRFWPLVALIIAIATAELAIGFQQLSFLNTFKSFALLQSAPENADPSRAAREGYAAAAAWGADGTLDPATVALVNATAALEDAAPAADPTQERTAAAGGASAESQLQRLREAVRERRRAVYTAALATLCAPSGSALLDALASDITDLCLQARAVPDLPAAAGPLLAAHPLQADVPQIDNTSALFSLSLQLQSSRDPDAVAGEDSTADTVAQIRGLPARPARPRSAASERWSQLPALAESAARTLAGFQWRGPQDASMPRAAQLAQSQLDPALRALAPQAAAAELKRLMAAEKPVARDATPDTPVLVASAEAALQRAWLTLWLFAGAAPPNASVLQWLWVPPQHERLSAQLALGLSLEDVDRLLQARREGVLNLVELMGAQAASLQPIDTGTRLVGRVRLTSDALRTTHELLSLGFADAQLDARAQRLTRERELLARPADVLQLELALGACFAFWATAGLLAASASQDPRRAHGGGKPEGLSAPDP